MYERFMLQISISSYILIVQFHSIKIKQYKIHSISHFYTRWSHKIYTMIHESMIPIIDNLNIITQDSTSFIVSILDLIKFWCHFQGRTKILRNKEQSNEDSTMIGRREFFFESFLLQSCLFLWFNSFLRRMHTS